MDTEFVTDLAKGQVVSLEYSSDEIERRVLDVTKRLLADAK